MAEKGAVPAKPIIRYHLEDKQQDLMWLDVQGGVIVDVGGSPSDCRIFKDQLHYDYFSKMNYEKNPLKEGDKFRFSKSPDDDVFTLRYLITEVEFNPKKEAIDA